MGQAIFLVSPVALTITSACFRCRGFESCNRNYLTNFGLGIPTRSALVQLGRHSNGLISGLRPAP